MGEAVPTQRQQAPAAGDGPAASPAASPAAPQQPANSTASLLASMAGSADEHSSTAAQAQQQPGGTGPPAASERSSAPDVSREGSAPKPLFDAQREVVLRYEFVPDKIIKVRWLSCKCARYRPHAAHLRPFSRLL